MAKKIPTLKPRKGCNHKNSDPLYARGDKSWTSTQKINGVMTYVCYDCGAFFRKANETLKKTESMSAGDALEKEGEQ